MNRPLCLALICSAALSASASAGYLALIGPAPLRFAGRARSVPQALARLPKLELEDPLPPVLLTNTVAVVTATNPPPVGVATVVTPPATPPVVTFPPAPPAPVATNPPVVFPPFLPPPPTGLLLGPLLDPNDPNSLLTPQMLIQYFRPQGTNAPGVSVLAPFFSPPRPAVPPSSTVRYTTP